MFTEVSQKRVLNALIEQQALYNKAVENGFDQDPTFLLQQRKLLANAYKRYLKRQVEENALITEGNLKQYFDENIQSFTTPAKLRLAIYQRNKTSEDKQKLPLDRLKKLVTGLPVDKGFGRFAKDSDHKSSRHRGGKLAWLSEKSGMASVPDAVIQQGLALKNIGDISEVITTKQGQFLVRLIDKREAVVADFAQQRPAIKQKLMHEIKQAMLSAYIDKAVSSYEITIHKEHLVSKQKEEAPHNFAPPGIAVK